MATKKCKECGASFDTTFSFCPHCGARIKEDIDAADSYRSLIKSSPSTTDDRTNDVGKNAFSYDKYLDFDSIDTAQAAFEKQAKPTKVKTDSAQKKTPKISGGKLLATFVCCVPVVIELLLVLLIPHIDSLAENAYMSRFGWQALSVPMKVSFLSLIVLGFIIQVLGLFGKLNKPLGIVTQIVSFLLFVLSAYAAYHNEALSFTQWGLAMVVPVSLLVAALRYMSADKFGFDDDFNFWHYLPIALEVTEYSVFFLVFPLMFGVSPSLWIFAALTVTTIGAIAVSSFWQDMRWHAAGINLAVAALLCLIYWLGKLFSSEWMWNGGVILVVILAIGGSWFIHWFIHRNDDEKLK